MHKRADSMPAFIVRVQLFYRFCTDFNITPSASAAASVAHISFRFTEKNSCRVNNSGHFISIIPLVELEVIGAAVLLFMSSSYRTNGFH